MSKTAFAPKIPAVQHNTVDKLVIDQMRKFLKHPEKFPDEVLVVHRSANPRGATVVEYNKDTQCPKKWLITFSVAQLCEFCKMGTDDVEAYLDMLPSV